MNLVIYFGVPCNEAYAEADITLEIKDSQTGAIIGTIQESSRVENAYTIYNMKAGEAGAELSEAFRDVAKKLKQDFFTRVNLQ